MRALALFVLVIQGRLWALDTIVVCVGETRRFNFKKIKGVSGQDRTDPNSQSEEPHSVRVAHGDCVWMFSDCQVSPCFYLRQVFRIVFV